MHMRATQQAKHVIIWSGNSSNLPIQLNPENPLWLLNQFHGGLFDIPKHTQFMNVTHVNVQKL